MKKMILILLASCMLVGCSAGVNLHGENTPTVTHANV